MTWLWDLNYESDKDAKIKKITEEYETIRNVLVIEGMIAKVASTISRYDSQRRTN